MCIFRNLTRCTSTNKLAFGRVIYVWKYSFFIYNHQEGGIWKYLFVRYIFHTSKELSFFLDFSLLTISSHFEGLLLYNLFSVNQHSNLFCIFFSESVEKEGERRCDGTSFLSGYHTKL